MLTLVKSHLFGELFPLLRGLEDIVTIFALCFHGIRFKVKKPSARRDDGPMVFPYPGYGYGKLIAGEAYFLRFLDDDLRFAYARPFLATRLEGAYFCDLV